jgi:8-oxo-dGTP diphosphatase
VSVHRGGHRVEAERTRCGFTTRVTRVNARPAPGHRLPRKRVAPTMLFTDPDGRVLVVKPTYEPRWELPGGAVEDGESPRAAAAREVAEELGIDREAGALLAVDYVPADGARTEGLIVVFDGGTIDDPGRLRLPPDELSDWAFVEPERIADHLPALQARRAHAALRARRAGLPLYLEDGRCETPSRRDPT